MLRVIAYVAGHHSSFLANHEHATPVLDAVIAMARSIETDNDALHQAIGAALAPFYLDGGFNKGETFILEPIKYLLAAAISGKTRLHREIPLHEVTLESEIFQSPLCKVSLYIN